MIPLIRQKRGLENGYGFCKPNLTTSALPLTSNKKLTGPFKSFFLSTMNIAKGQKRFKTCLVIGPIGDGAI
jgi:hypothetical protein